MSTELSPRLWPGIAAVTLQWLLRFGLPLVMQESMAYAMGAAVVGGLVVLLWWLFFSRIGSALFRFGAVAVIVAAAFATKPLLDKSIATGMMGLMFPLSSIPFFSMALVAWAVFARSSRVALVCGIVAASLGWTLLRTDGVMGEGTSNLTWRWVPTAEEKLPSLPGPTAPAAPPTEVLAVPTAKPVETAAAVVAAAPVVYPWPGFRGSLRNGVAQGVTVDTDWTTHPLKPLWRRPIGPAWSSFAVAPGRIYTQEQRGNSELVTCYDAATGEPRWTHADATRFWESNAGAGPRGTPTLHAGKLFSFGGTGLLNALDAATGAKLWSRNVAGQLNQKTPEWGFSSSPLVVEDLVIVAAASQLAAYDIATGEPRWHVQTGKMSYSSPQLLTLGGVPQVVLPSDAGVVSVAPADGKQLWMHAWDGFTLLQPTITENGDGILLTTSSAAGGLGVRRLAVSQQQAGVWKVEERWTSRGLKPYFSDIVVHKGHAYGLDGAILSAIDLNDGNRKWKGGRYGHGQVLLLPGQDLLLVVTEEGELALVSAKPDEFRELARVPAIEGKTWNHPALVGNTLYVRNGQEMAAFVLPGK